MGMSIAHGDRRITLTLVEDHTMSSESQKPAPDTNDAPQLTDETLEDVAGGKHGPTISPIAVTTVMPITTIIPICPGPVTLPLPIRIDDPIGPQVQKL